MRQETELLYLVLLVMLTLIVHLRLKWTAPKSRHRLSEKNAFSIALSTDFVEKLRV